MFRYTDMTEVTHELESLLDKARRREIELTAEMIDALLAAGDVLKTQLARHRGDTSLAEPPVAETCERIRHFVRGAQAVPAPVADAAPQALSRSVVLRFPADTDGAVPAALLAELERLGHIESHEVCDGRCRVVLETGRDDEALREAFAFNIDPAGVEISPTAGPAADPGYGFFTDPTPGPEAADPGYGF